MSFVLHRLIEDVAAHRPDAPAVLDGERRVTYGELNARANQLAHLLQQLGVRRGDRIGLYLEKSVEAVTAIYAVLKCGAAYVPLDPRAPIARLTYMATDCGLRCLVTGLEKAERWPALVEDTDIKSLIVANAGSQETVGEHLDIDVRTSDDIDRMPTTSPGIAAIDLDLAYILYTSGSTGEPKGVMLTHRNGLAYVNWAVDELGIEPTDRLSCHAPLHFDLTILDLFAASKAGACVVLVPPKISVFPVELARFIEEKRITVWYSVPSILTMLVERGGVGVGAFPRLRMILFAGEVFPTKYLRRLTELVPHADFYNLYGPTETNVCTFHRVQELPDDDAETIPIGRAIDNVDCFVVTKEGALAPPGKLGELVVRGSTVMRGYWGDDERTNRQLVENPFATGPADLVYCTGDLVMEEADGTLRFLGRRDNQIKSRGYRIELGDIEAALNSHPDIIECAVVAIPDRLVTNRLKAFVAASADTVTERDVATFCAERLPKYMIPTEFEFRDTLPKTSTGKINRRGLTSRSPHH